MEIIGVRRIIITISGVDSNDDDQDELTVCSPGASQY